MSILSDDEAMKLAIQQAKLCIPSPGAYSVGSILLDKDGKLISTGHSRELPGNTHAEQVCFIKAENVNVEGGCIYTTMEPCSTRLSGQEPCTFRILQHKLKRVVYGVKEPDHFVHCEGVGLLENAGIEVVHLSDYEAECLSMNSHIVS